MKHSAWIQTHTGVAFDLLDPQPDMVRIEDIGHALSMICRYTGHVKKFYSVAEHSIEVAERVPVELAWEGLMHDAAEAYVMDVSSPLKRAMRAEAYPSDYDLVERRVRAAIVEKFDLLPELPAEVKRVDLQMLYLEKEQLFHVQPAEWNISAPRDPRLTKGPLMCHSPAEARWAFEISAAEYGSR